MKRDLHDILANLNGKVDPEILVLYLQGKLSQDQRHEVEKHLIDNDFDDEALQGLEKVKDKDQVSATVDQLNRDLRIKTAKKKKRRRASELKEDPWLWIALLIILLLIVISFVIIHKQMQEG